MIAYSANIGHKDRYRQPLWASDDVECVYFVDDKERYESDLWDVREMPRRLEDPRLEARWYKMHPHLLFPGEDTIWMDSSMIPIADPSPLFINDIVLYEHDNRDCVYEEAQTCLERAGQMTLANPACSPAWSRYSV